MTSSAGFRWHPAARLFAGPAEVHRPAPAAPTFRRIAAQPTADALPALGLAILSGAPFCVSDDVLPDIGAVKTTDFLTLTGGSSGMPKIVRRSQASWIASFEVNAQHFGLTPHDNLAVLGALSHSLALYGVLEGMHLGLDTLVLGDIRPVQQAEEMAHRRTTVLYATPTQLRLLCRTDRRLPGVRLILCGGGALDAHTHARISQACPNAAIQLFYGAAETSFITMSRDGAQTGRAYPGVDLLVLDTQGRPATDIGEVWVRSPYLFDGYAAGASPETRWRNGFLCVGEMGRLTVAGDLQIIGRASRMVKVADEQVFPERLETFLTAQTGQPCAAVPVPDGLRGQRLVAVVQMPDGAALPSGLREACRRALGPRTAPARVFGIRHLPVLASGKVDLAAVLKWVEAQSCPH